MAVLLPLLLSLLAVPLVLLAGAIRPRWAAPAGVLGSALAFAGTLWTALGGGGAVDIAWAPAWNLRLSFVFDGLAALFTLLATGIGLAVAVYSWSYIPRHLQHKDRPQAEQVGYFALLLLFMASMVGLVISLDLLLLFIFWDLTAITSYFLIGFDREKAEAREAALMAFLVTGISSVLFLIGAFILQVAYETFSLRLLFQEVQSDTLTTAAVTLMAVAALAKSAQVPFHFWLPRAMAAPTPVSAYLHSAAMVAAGVFLLARLFPLLQTSRLILDGLIVVGLLSIAVGGFLALTKDHFKQVLAYSTISQYGYVVLMLGVGGPLGVGAAMFYVLVHAPIKSALFLTAGAVTEATGMERLSEAGGMAHSLPWVAAGSGAAAASLAALPLTAGFFKDELLFKTALERGPLLAALTVLAAAITFAYTWRWWSGIFLGPAQRRTGSPGLRFVAPIVVLGMVVLTGGFFVSPFTRLAEAAGAAALRELTPLEPAYHLDLRTENLMALATYAMGLLFIAAGRAGFGVTTAMSAAGRRIGPERLYRLALRGANHASTRAFGTIRVLRLGDRALAMLVPAALLLALSLWATPVEGTYRVGAFDLAGDLPVAIALLLTAGAALAVAFPKGHLTLVLMVAAVNYALAAFFTFFGAPDVSLVMVLIGTVSTLFFLGIFVLLPQDMLQLQVARSRLFWQRLLDVGAGIGAGGMALIVSWSVLSQTPPRPTVASELIRLTPSVHAGDVVTAILADFRGLDTVGEITVVAVAVLGTLTLLRRRYE